MFKNLPQHVQNAFSDLLTEMGVLVKRQLLHIDNGETAEAVRIAVLVHEKSVALTVLMAPFVDVK